MFSWKKNVKIYLFNIGVYQRKTYLYWKCYQWHTPKNYFYLFLGNIKTSSESETVNESLKCDHVFKWNRLGLCDMYYVFYRLLSTTHSKKLAYLLRKNATEWFSGGSRGRVQGVLTPPWYDLRFSNTTGILQKKKKNYVVYWCWSRARDECTPLLKKILDPPLES